MTDKKDQKGMFYGYIIVAIGVLIMIAFWTTYYSFGVFLNPVLKELGWSRAVISGAYSLSMIIQGIFGILIGGLNDRFGPRIVMTICGVFIGLGYILMAYITSVWHFYVFFGLFIGIGMTGAWIPLLSTIARWFVKRRNLMSGILVSGTGFGAFLAPLIANPLISAYNWRGAYIILGASVLIIIVIVSQFLRRDPARMGLVPYGANSFKERDPEVSTEGFSLRESFYTWQLWIFCGMLFCFGYCLFAVMVHIVPHAIDIGIPEMSAGGILSALGISAIVGRVLLGGAAEKIGNKNIFIIGFLLFTAVLFWITPARELWMFFPFAMFFGLAHGGMGASESPTIASLFGLRLHGLIFGITGLGFALGAAAGPFLTGYIYDITESYRTAFLVCTAIAILGLIQSSILKPTLNKKKKL